MTFLLHRVKGGGWVFRIWGVRVFTFQYVNYLTRINVWKNRNIIHYLMKNTVMSREKGEKYMRRPTKLQEKTQMQILFRIIE